MSSLRRYSQVSCNDQPAAPRHEFVGPGPSDELAPSNKAAPRDEHAPSDNHGEDMFGGQPEHQPPGPWHERA